MRNPLVIGDKVFKYKKDALTHYQTILNSYKFGESLSDEHFDDLLDLLNYDYLYYQEQEIKKIDDKEVENQIEDIVQENETELLIEDIRIGKAQYDTKCFEVFYNDSSSCYISYLLIINRPIRDPNKDFNRACRNTIQEDIRLVKLKYFQANSKKGLVKCQETRELNKWVDLVVDHRQPNTFSIIVERFKEVKQIDVDKIEFVFDDMNKLVFKDQNLKDDFLSYHKEKANLRIIKKVNNLSRTGMARVKQTSKDLKIE